MVDAIFSLRFVLLLLGGLLVAVIYFWGARRIRRNKRIKYEPRRTRFEPQNRRYREEGRVEAPFDSFPDEEAATTYTDEISARAEAPTELPVITRDAPDDAQKSHAKRKDAQLELTFEAELANRTSGLADVQPLEDTIITLYLRSPEKIKFSGPAIMQAMTGAGLRYGEMNIFHHYGAGDLLTELPLFSVANMVEPGHFDLQDIENFATPGLAMFLRLPTALDGAVAFELFLNTAQRLAEALAADLYGAPNRPLDSAAIEQMRRSALPYTNGG